MGKWQLWSTRAFAMRDPSRSTGTLCRAPSSPCAYQTRRRASFITGEAWSLLRRTYLYIIARLSVGVMWGGIVPEMQRDGNPYRPTLPRFPSAITPTAIENHSVRIQPLISHIIPPFSSVCLVKIASFRGSELLLTVNRRYNAVLPPQPLRPILPRSCQRLTGRCDSNGH